MRFVTDFADQAVVLPALAVTCTALLAVGWRRAAIALAGSSLAVTALVTLGKVTLFACPALAANALGLSSPSGHTATAATLYGGLAALLLASRRPLGHALACAVVVAVAVGASRLALGAHSAADVTVGTIIGVAGACAVVSFAGPRPSRAGRRWIVVPLALAAALLFHGQHLRAEEMLKDYARLLSPPSVCRPADPGAAGLVVP